MNLDQIRIEVTINDPRAPSGSLPQRVWFNIDRSMFKGAFSPLPKDRELSPFIEKWVKDMEMEQLKARNNAAEVITQHMVLSIMEAISKIDTINGYTPKQWEEMNNQNKS